MTMLEKIDHHGALMQRMADIVDADLGAALIGGHLSGEGLRAAVLRCTRCEAADFCESWLDVHEGRKADTGATPNAPDFCLNQDLMDRLRA
jgi:hypothetical protein